MKCDPIDGGGRGCYVAHGEHVMCSCSCHKETPEIDKLVDAVILAVCECHDGGELWDHAKRDPDAFRRTVLNALRVNLRAR